MRVVGAAIVSDPLIVLGVDVRDFRMTFLVRGNTVLGCGTRLLASLRGRSSRRLGSVGGSRAVSGNVSTANRCLVTAAWLVSALLTLRESSHTNQNR